MSVSRLSLILLAFTTCFPPITSGSFSIKCLDEYVSIFPDSANVGEAQELSFRTLSVFVYAHSQGET